MNNNYTQLHETVVRDIFDVINSVKDFDEVEWLKKRNNSGSIAKRASGLVVVFPAIVSSSNDIQSATIACKAIERKCATLLQLLFSAMQFTNADNLYDYLKKFHTNLDFKNGMDIDELMGFVDDLVDEGALTITDKDAYDIVMEDMKNINYVLDTEFHSTPLSDYKVVNRYNEQTVILNEAPHKTPRQQQNMEDSDKMLNGLVDAFGKSVDSMGSAFTKTAGNVINYKSTSGVNNLKNMTDYYKDQITSKEIKKANELVPTTMMVNFVSVQDGVKINTTGVIGVKVKMYPVDAMEIVSRISSKVKDTNTLFNLVRASTREISFFKDLAFAVDKAKLDAIYMGKNSDNAKMFRLLERRAAKNKLMSAMKRNDASPITSLILSQDDVEYLKKYSNLDLEKSYSTRTLLESYNLMDITIMDSSLEIAKFLFDDGDGAFETLTYDSLEKEASDGSYKKVVNLMSKINR